MKLSTFALLSLALPFALALPAPRSDSLAARGDVDSKGIVYEDKWDHKCVSLSSFPLLSLSLLSPSDSLLLFELQEGRSQVRSFRPCFLVSSLQR